MEKSNKRGKIPQSDWPLIMARYEAGETLASIARTYDCSPPAISYVVSKSRARQSSPERSIVGTSGQDAQLVKSIAGDPANPGSAERPRLDAPPVYGAAWQYRATRGNRIDRLRSRRRTPDAAAWQWALRSDFPRSALDGSPRHDVAERGLLPAQAPALGRMHTRAARAPEAGSRLRHPPRAGPEPEPRQDRRGAVGRIIVKGCICHSATAPRHMTVQATVYSHHRHGPPPMRAGPSREQQPGT